MSSHGKCHILSLPKELRLEIWTYVLTDPSVPDLAAEITRQPLSPSKSSLRFPHPHIQVTLNPSRNAPINLALLRANRLIYEECLPMLYTSVRFAPLDLEGLFPLFLDTLPAYNRSLIRHARLRIPSAIYDIDLFGDPSTYLFHWAVTCAQVAKVENLRDVEIDGFEEHESRSVARGILNPLAKMKAAKIFRGINRERAKVGLLGAEADLLYQALRRVQAQSDGDGAERTGNVLQTRGSNDSDPIPISSVDETPSPSATTSDSNDMNSAQQPNSPQQPRNEHTTTFPPAYPDDDPPPYSADWDIVSVDSVDSSTSDNAPSSPSSSSSSSPSFYMPQPQPQFPRLNLLRHRIPLYDYPNSANEVDTWTDADAMDTDTDTDTASSSSSPSSSLVLVSSWPEDRDRDMAGRDQDQDHDSYVIRRFERQARCGISTESHD